MGQEQQQKQKIPKPRRQTEPELVWEGRIHARTGGNISLALRARISKEASWNHGAEGRGFEMTLDRTLVTMEV